MWSVTTWLIVINCLVLLWDGIFASATRGQWLAVGEHLYFSYDRAVTHLELWRWIGFQFVHGGILHLFFNMLGLYFFGPMMENWWGPRRFLAFYLICGLAGAFLYTLLVLMPGLISVSETSPLVGASGGLFGILIGAAVVAPHQRVMLLFPPIPMTLRTMALVFLGIAVLTILANSVNAGGQAAHLGGAALGFLLVKQPRLLGWAEHLGPRRGPRYHKPSRLRRWLDQRQQQRIEEEDRRVDEILDKVRHRGLASLTATEKRILHRATQRQQKGE